MSGQLAGAQIAVTRPTGQGDALLAALRTEGARATHVPLLAIEPVYEADRRQVIRRQLAALADYQHIIFVSRNAVEQALPLLSEAAGHWPPGARYYAVGRSTAAVLQAQGLVVSVPDRMDSEGLLALTALQQVAGHRCLVVRGVGGRETLARGLRARGAEVDYCELYRRTVPQQAAAQWQAWLRTTAGRPALVCISSGEAIDNLLALAADSVDNENLTLLVPGERVRQHALAAGFTRVVGAPDALDDTVLRMAICWWQDHRLTG